MISNLFLQCHFAKQCYFAHFGCKKSARISKNTIHHRGIYSASHAWTFHTRLLTQIPSKSINYCKNKISILFLTEFYYLSLNIKGFFSWRSFQYSAANFCFNKGLCMIWNKVLWAMINYVKSHTMTLAFILQTDINQIFQMRYCTLL